jgi:hypothetical protein
MKIGDLVRFKSNAYSSIGIVIEVGVYAGNKDVKVLWDGIDTYTERSAALEVVQPS